MKGMELMEALEKMLCVLSVVVHACPAKLLMNLMIEAHKRWSHSRHIHTLTFDLDKFLNGLDLIQ